MIIFNYLSIRFNHFLDEQSRKERNVIVISLLMYLLFSFSKSHTLCHFTQLAPLPWIHPTKKEHSPIYFNMHDTCTWFHCSYNNKYGVQDPYCFPFLIMTSGYCETSQNFEKLNRNIYIYI